jgi:hypothetical protein
METNHERHAQEAWEKEVIFIQLPVHRIWAGFFEDWKDRLSCILFHGRLTCLMGRLLSVAATC